MSIPTGPIQSSAPGGGKFNTLWEVLTQYDPLIHTYADPVAWPIERIRATIAIESRGNPRAIQKNDQNGWSYGLMQVVPFGVGWGGWSGLVMEKAGLSRGASRDEVIAALYEPFVNIAVGVQILENFYLQHGTLDRAQSAFFIGRPDWGSGDTVNGTTGRQYRASLNALIAEQKSFAPPNPIAIIMGRDQYNDAYGFKSPTSLPYYAYFVGHGGNANQHTGIDIPGDWGDPLRTPLPGIVTCGGTDVGRGSWGTSCAAFPSVSGGAGRVEILLDAGPSLILGHCASSRFPPGTRVAAGEQVATMGSYNGAHVHIETRTWDGRDYLITDPRATLLAAMGGGAVPIPIPDPVYAERLPIPQPQEFLKWARVVITEDGVRLLQRADMGSQDVASPFVKGEEFDAVYQAIGNDRNIYWISRIGTRVSVEGTHSDEWTS